MFKFGTGRLVQPSDIPATLWCKKNSRLHLPPILVSSWRSLIENKGLLDQAKMPVPEKLAGGASEKDTNDHLAWKFTGSSARVSMLMLDPHSNLEGVSDAFIQTFSGNRVFVADIPCGSGAAILTVLTTLAELRKQNLIPRNQLTVVILGGELSTFARDNATSMLQESLEDLEGQAITVEFKLTAWNVLNKLSSSDLVKEMTLASQGAAAKMVLLANFSDFLQKGGKLKQALPQIEEVFRHSRDTVFSTAIWLEPDTNTVIQNDGGMFSRVIKWFKETFTSFNFGPNECYATSKSSVQHPLKEHAFNTQLAVIRFDLPKVEEK